MYNIAFNAENIAKLRMDSLQRDLEARQLREAAREAREADPLQVRAGINSASAQIGRFAEQRLNTIRALFAPTNEPGEQCC